MKKRIYLIQITFALVFLFAGTAKSQTIEIPKWILNNQPKDVADLDLKDSLYLQTWLNKNALSPMDYLLSKFKKHQVVVLGEVHEGQANLLFVKDAISVLYGKGVLDCLGLEVCNAEDNEKIEKLVTAAKFDNELALSIARGGNWATWGFKEYWDLFYAVWQINQSAPAGKAKLKIVGLNRKADLILHQMGSMGKLKTDEEKGAFNAQLPVIIKNDSLLAFETEKEILNKNLRTLILVGNMHAFTHYSQPMIRNGVYDGDMQPRMCGILYKKYGEKIFHITLHMDNFPLRMYAPSLSDKRPVLPWVMEEMMRKRGKGPYGFDVHHSPFATLRDTTSYYFHFQKKVVFSDVCRGYILLVPWESRKQCSWTPNFITNEMYLKYKDFFEFRFRKQFASAAEVNAFFEGMNKR